MAWFKIKSPDNTAIDQDAIGMEGSLGLRGGAAGRNR